MHDFEWDDAKRQLVLEKHGLDFRVVLQMFAEQHVMVQARSEIEQRLIAVGRVHEMMVAVVFTMRGDKVRLVTARRARENERRAYYARYS